MYQIKEKIAALRRIERLLEAYPAIFKGSDEVRQFVDAVDESGIKKWFDKNAPLDVLSLTVLRERARIYGVIRWWLKSKEQLLVDLQKDSNEHANTLGGYPNASQCTNGRLTFCGHSAEPSKDHPVEKP